MKTLNLIGWALLMLIPLSLPLAAYSKDADSSDFKIVKFFSKGAAEVELMHESVNKALGFKSLPIVLSSFEMPKIFSEKDNLALQGVFLVNPNLLLTIGTVATKVVVEKNATVSADRGIVFLGIVHPENYSFIAGNKNITGVSLDLPPLEQLRYIKNIKKDISRVGVIYCAQDNKSQVAEYKKTLTAEGYTFRSWEVASIKEVNELDFSSLDIDCLLILPDRIVCQPVVLRYVFAEALKSNIIVSGINAGHVQAGAVIGFEPDYNDVGVQAADIVERIYNGEKPENIGFAHPRKMRYYLNSAILKRLNLELAQEFRRSAKEIFGE